MNVDLLSSRNHYTDHLLPIWRELEQRGLAGVAYRTHGLDADWPATTFPRPPGARGVVPVLVASHDDYQRTYPAPVIYVEHGAGQAYDGDPASAGVAGYSGAANMERVVLFICPNQTVADRWLRRYPNAEVAIVGSPKMDGWYGYGRRIGEEDVRPTVGLTFHWECAVCPESRSAWLHYEHGLGELRAWADDAGIALVGHAHPRIYRRCRESYERAGIMPTPSLNVIFGLADVLCFDNTSAGFEFASLDRPVVVMNAPWYRREIDHGGRFWEWAAVGPNVDDVEALPLGIMLALQDPAWLAENRRRISRIAYAHVDGRASFRAANAIGHVLNGPNAVGTPNPRGF